MALVVTTIPIAVLSVSLNAAAQIALRKTMLSVGPVGQGGYWSLGLEILLSPWFIAGMACYALSIGIWLIVLSRLEVSAAYPLLSIGYVITAVVGYFFLNENVDSMRIVGIALICVGIIFISRSA
jgi:multidrug transporter EmrE-like cation transporter